MSLAVMPLSVAALVAALGLLIGSSLWLDQSALVPVVGRESVTYYFCSAPLTTLVRNIVLAGVALCVLHLLVERWVIRPRQSSRPRVFAGLYLAPVAFACFNLLGLAVLNERLRDVWAPVAYLAVDLRWPLIVVAAGLSVLTLRAQTSSAPVVEASGARRPLNPLAIDLLLAAAVMAFAIVTTPHIRFTAFATGDEPKYIRYAENWFQGNGMQIDTFKNVYDLPAGDKQSHLIRNLSYLPSELAADANSLAADLATLADPANWTRRFNRAEAAENHVVRGRNGWHYQIHGPGLSVLILPAYVIDRKIFDRGSSMFADDMFTTNAVLLLVYAAFTLVVYRLALAAGVRPLVALISSGALMLSLPVAAFPFQFYPETTAGLITCAVALRIVQSTPLTCRAALAIATALTFMGWLHVRFLVVSGLAFLWLLWSFRDQSRAVLATLVLGFAAGMSTLCLYAYHVTGSLLPSAPFALGVGSGFVWDRVPVGLMAMLIDRVYGLLPLAPVYFLAIPGLGLMARSQPRTLALVATLAMGLIVPSAGQGYWTDGSVPLRHALAVLPLGVVPLALWLERRGRRPLTAAFATLLIAMSVRTAIVYNLQNDKSITTLLDAGFSGWDVSLLFPITHRIRGNPLTEDAWLMFLAASLVIAAFAYGALSRDDHPVSVAPWRLVTAVALVSAGLLLLGSAAIAAGAPAHRWELLRAYRPPFQHPASCWIQTGTPPPRH